MTGGIGITPGSGFRRTQLSLWQRQTIIIPSITTTTITPTTTPTTIAIGNLEFDVVVGQPLALHRSWFPNVLHPCNKNKMSNYIV
jgi:hypothetical protein